MGRGSEAQDLYPEVTSPAIEQRRKLEVIKGGAEKKVPEKVQKKIAKKVAACISAGIVVSSGGFIALGETGNLPEPVQEWYDTTAEAVRSVFGIEELNRWSPNSPETVFNGLEIEGLNTFWQNSRWEYVDPNDNSVIGYWNEKEGRYEHTADVLKGEWKGLFVNVNTDNGKEILMNSLRNEVEWSKENWENGNITIPILADMSKGGVIEQRNLSGILILGSGGPVKFIVGKDFPNDTVLSVPFSTTDTQKLLNNSPELTSDFTMSKDSLHLVTIFNKSDQFLPEEKTDSLDPLNEIKIGTPFIKLDDQSFLPKSFLQRFSLLMQDDYQFIISGQYDSEPLDCSFNNFLRDDQGRFLYFGSNFEEVLIKESREAPEIEGLTFNKEKNIYFTEKENPYGLPVGKEAAIWVAEGIISHGEIRSAIGLSPDLIDYFNRKNQKTKIVIPFDIRGLNLDIEEGFFPYSGGKFLYFNFKSEEEKKITFNAVFSGNYGRGFDISIFDKKYNNIYYPLDDNFQLSFGFNENNFSLNHDDLKNYLEKKFKIGDTIGEINFSNNDGSGFFLINSYNSNTQEYTTKDLDFNDFLKINDLITFLFLP